MATKKQKTTNKKPTAKKAAPGTTANALGKKGETKASAPAETSLAALPEDLACRGCVEQAVRNVCGPFTSISQTLDDICAPCNTGKLHQLEQAVAHCAGDTAPTLECSMTVRDVIDAVCG